jgi:hypothetical protein
MGRRKEIVVKPVAHYDTRVMDVWCPIEGRMVQMKGRLTQAPMNLDSFTVDRCVEDLQCRFRKHSSCRVGKCLEGKWK